VHRWGGGGVKEEEEEEGWGLFFSLSSAVANAADGVPGRLPHRLLVGLPFVPRADLGLHTFALSRPALDLGRAGAFVSKLRFVRARDSVHERNGVGQRPKALVPVVCGCDCTSRADDSICCRYCTTGRCTSNNTPPRLCD
jgi:hypothetical protein